MLDNVQRHEVFLLRLLAKLYSAHPRAIEVHHATLRVESTSGDLIGGISDEEAHGAIVWAYRNDLIHGSLDNGGSIGGPPRAIVFDGQLSPRSLRVLSDERNSFNRKFGDEIVEAAATEREPAMARKLFGKLFP